MPRTIRIIVTGKVQGVYYRQSTKERARDLQLTGEVRNLPDETVVIIATGETEQLDLLIEWCKTGPPRAVVTCVMTEEIPLKPFDKFNVIR